MVGGAWVRFGWLAAAVLFTVAAMLAMAQPRGYGQSLVAQYQLPPETIARYASMAAGTAPDATPRENSMFADPSPWVGPTLHAGVGHNPYTLVFSVSGVVRAAGAVYTQWQAGWELHESPLASREVLMEVTPLERADVAAGQTLTLTASSTRVSFRGERHVAPMLGLVQTRNLDVNDVRVQVWSGVAPPVWAALPWPPAGLLALGVACLLAVWALRFWSRRRPGAPARPGGDAGAPPGPAPAPSQEALVIAALQQVLTDGLSVPTVPDESRPKKRRRAR
jgi:hypothetical protein